MNFITGNKFKKICDYVLDGNGFHKTNVTNSTPIYFVKTDYIDNFFSNHIPNIPFKLITHNSDYHITYHHKRILDTPNLISWWAQNVDFEHIKLKSIPIGVANEIWPHGDEYTIKQVINNPKKKEKIIYANFNVDTNRIERNNCLINITSKGVHTSEKKTFHEYLEELSSSFFCISPNGNGVDCHKTWESFYLKTIPIVTESINMKFYEEYPIYKIKSWDSFNPSIFTEELYNRIIEKYDSDKLDINYYYNLIRKND